MVTEAITVMEDDPNLNAGYGSNLTLTGTVECDAAIMTGRSHDFGSVGAVAGVKNPIRLARSVLEHSRKPDILGRIPPMTLVSHGAREFAITEANTIQLVPEMSLVTPRSQEQWKTWIDRMETGPVENSVGMGDVDIIQDTVGAVAWHSDEAVAAGVSSGGLLLKYPGRVGEAAVFGAGCWAHENVAGKQTMGCSISGAGEYIVRAMLARTIGKAFEAAWMYNKEPDPHEILHNSLTHDFNGMCHSRGERNHSAGVLLLTTRTDDSGHVFARLWCAFTAPSMAIAYASSENPRPKAIILRRIKTTAALSDEEIFITAISI